MHRQSVAETPGHLWQHRSALQRGDCPEKPPLATEFTELIHISGNDIFKIFKNRILAFLAFLAQERALGPQNSKSAGRNLPGVLSRALEVGIGPIFAPITVADGMGSTVWIN